VHYSRVKDNKREFEYILINIILDCHVIPIVKSINISITAVNAIRGQSYMKGLIGN